MAGGITNLVVFNGQWWRQDHPANLYSALYKGLRLILDGQRVCHSRLRAWLAQGAGYRPGTDRAPDAMHDFDPNPAWARAGSKPILNA